MDMLLTLASTTIFTLMLTIGVNHSAIELLSVWRHPNKMIWALVAVLIVVPAAAMLLILVFDLSLGTTSGLALLAAAPGAPLTTKRAKAAGADIPYTAGLQLTLAISAVLVTPLILGLFYSFFDLSIERTSLGVVARQVAIVTLLPLIVGMSFKRLFPELVEKIRAPLDKLANGLFMALLAFAVVAVVVAELRTTLLIGWPGFFALLLFAMSALAAGHLIGGPTPERKSSLAIACLARNLGLAIYIAGLSANSEQILPTIFAYAALGTVLGLPYSIWTKRSGNS